MLTLLLPRFGLVASAAAVLGRCWVLSALWVVSDPPSQYKPPLGGRNKVSSSSSRHQALFVNWTLADVAQAKDGRLSAIARVGRMGAETCCPKVHLRGGGWTELADQVIPSRRNALITTCWDGDTTNGRGTNLIGLESAGL